MCDAAIEITMIEIYCRFAKKALFVLEFGKSYLGQGRGALAHIYAHLQSDWRWKRVHSSSPSWLGPRWGALRLPTWLIDANAIFTFWIASGVSFVTVVGLKTLSQIKTFRRFKHSSFVFQNNQEFRMHICCIATCIIKVKTNDDKFLAGGFRTYQLIMDTYV